MDHFAEVFNLFVGCFEQDESVFVHHFDHDLSQFVLFRQLFQQLNSILQKFIYAINQIIQGLVVGTKTFGCNSKTLAASLLDMGGMANDVYNWSLAALNDYSLLLKKRFKCTLLSSLAAENVMRVIVDDNIWRLCYLFNYI